MYRSIVIIGEIIVKSYRKILGLFILIMLIVPFSTVNAASVLAPKISFYAEPKASYITGETVNFKVYSKNYSGKVQYRVILYNTATKKSQDLWTNNDKYNRTLKPTGKSPVNIQWKVTQPGSYKIIVYTKRAGISSTKALYKKGNYDSTVTSRIFKVSKPLKKITLGTTKYEVLKILGEPYNSWTTDDNILVLLYNGGYIYLKVSGRYGNVIGWNNNSIPNINMADKDPKAAPIKLGSTMPEVAKANGTPQMIPPYYLNKEDDYWVYSDKSMVYFDKNKRVISYINKGSLRVLQGTKKANASPINHNSKPKDVISALGTPDAINVFYIESTYYSRHQVSVTEYPNPYIGDSYSVNFNTPYIYYQYKNSFISFDKNQKLMQFLNKDNLKIDFGKKDPNFVGLEVDSSEDDIIKSMGTPDRILNASEYERNWYYGKSYIYVDEKGKLLGWVNKGNLKVNKEIIKPDAPAINIGSTKQDVLNAMGSPDSFTLLWWEYGESAVYFDITDHVIRIHNPVNLKISNSKKDSESKGFAFNSSIDEVVEAMGIPDTITKDSSGYTVWQFGFNKPTYGLTQVTIYFNKEGNVVYWNSLFNKTLDLKISTIPQYDPLAGPLTIGSSKEDVLRVMGAPTSLASPEFNNVYWHFGTSYILFDDKGKVAGWSNSKGILKVFLRNKVEGATFSYGATKDEVLNSMGTPKTMYPSGSGLNMVFDNCWVIFDTATMKVDAWGGKIENLNLTKLQSYPEYQTFKKGSTYDEVLKVMGYPDYMDVEAATPRSAEYSKYATWRYGHSLVVFNQLGKVISWHNNDNNLKFE